jgi:nucleoside-diphosphate-sugar epimerase
VEVVQGSVSDAAFVEEAVKGMDAVCHLATTKEDREGFIDVSVRGTFNLLDASRECGHIKQFILAGGDASLGIFFYPNPEPLTESSPLRAYPGYYAFSKVLEETMCNQYSIQYQLPVTILRFSWIQDEDDILAYMTLAKPNFGGPAWQDLAETPEQKGFFEKGMDGVGLLRHPDGTPYTRHIVGVKDVVQAFLLALGDPLAAGQTFNIAAPEPFRYDELSAYIGEKLDLPVIDFTLDGCYDFSIDISRARDALGYVPQYDARAIVDDAIAFRESGGERSSAKYSG